MALINRAQAQKDDCWVDWSNGIQRCAAITAKGMQALRPTLGDLNVSRWLAACEAERPKWHRSVYAEGRARERLAVGAVAKNHSRSIYLGSELYVAAVASACDSHSLTSYDDTAAVDAQLEVGPSEVRKTAPSRCLQMHLAGV